MFMSDGPPSPAPDVSERGGTCAWRRIRDFLLRGGRLTKVAGEVASCAPSVGRAAPAALGAFADLVARAAGAGRAAAASVSMLGILAGTFWTLSAPEALAHREYRPFLGSDGCHNHPNSVGTNHEEFWCIGPANTPQLVSVSNRTANVVLGENANQTNIENVFYIYDGSKRALEILQSGPGGITVTRGPNRRVSMTSHGTVLRAVNRGAGNITISLSNATLRKSRNTHDSVVEIINEDAAGGSVTLNLGRINIGTGGTETHGNGHALHITNHGSGATTISASGHIVGVGTAGDGIRAIGSGSSIAGSLLSISVATVAGGRAGIDAEHRGGNVSIRATGSVTGGSGDGVRVHESGNGTAGASFDLSVAAVTGGRAGIDVEHRGGGDVSIRATGAVTGQGSGGDGIRLRNFTGDSAVTISAASVIARGTGADADAISVEQKADGGVSITVTGTVSAVGGHGIFVDNDGGGDVAINADGSGASVSRSGSHKKDAIRVENAGSGTIDVSVRHASAGSGYDAITVDSEGRGDITVTIRGTVTSGTGAARAVRIETPSGVAAAITLKSGAVVKGVIEDDGADTELIVESGARLERNVFLGAGDDTFVLNRRGDFTGQQVNLGAGTDTLRINFPISGHPKDFLADFANGWENLHFGRGGHFREPWIITRSNNPINIFNRFTFDVDVRRLEGVKMTQTGRGGITFTQSGGFMRAAQYPIAALNSGEGDVSITLAGEVKSHDQKGGKKRYLNDMRGKRWRNYHQGLVHAENKDASGGNVWVAVGSVQASTVSGQYQRHRTKAGGFVVVITAYAGGGMTNAVSAKNQGTGATTVIAKGKLRGGSLFGDGVKVETGSLTTSVDVSVGDVEVRSTGVYIIHGGTGNVSITAAGTIEALNHNLRSDHHFVRGDNGSGILVTALNPESSGNFKVDAASITASAEGISVKSSSTGNISVNATGTISAGRHGIAIEKGSGTGSIFVNAASITASVDGIVVRSSSTDNISISATSAVAASGGHGIFIEEKGSGTNSVSVNALGSVSGGKSGIKASGKIGSITISAATVTGGTEHGINLELNKGQISITQRGNITGDKHGIRVNSSNTVDLSVTGSGMIVGKKEHGIHAFSKDSVFISATTRIVGKKDGIHASADGTSDNTAINISAGNVEADSAGIVAYHNRLGNISIKATGVIEAAGGHGISAISRKGGSPAALSPSSIAISVATVTGGGGHGIHINAAGSGTISVNALGEVSAARDGVRAYVRGANTRASMTVSVATVTGDWVGLRVKHEGRGDVSVRATGTLTTRGRGFTDAAFSLNLPNKSKPAGNVIVNLATLTATSPHSGSGIFVNQFDPSHSSFTVSGPITTRRALGFWVYNAGSGQITFNALDEIRAYSHAIKINRTYNPASPSPITVNTSKRVLSSLGHGMDITVPSGDVSVTAIGTVSGKRDGIRAEVRSNGSGSLTFSVATVTGEWMGMRMTQRGHGVVSIRSTGTVTGKGRDDSAVWVSLSSSTNTEPVTLNLAAVTAEGTGASAHGILVRSSATGSDISVSATGQVSAAGGHGVQVGNHHINRGGHRIDLSLAGVTGGKSGVHLTHWGTGDVSIRASGTVLAKNAGTAQEVLGAVSVALRNSGGAGSLTLNLATVTAEGSGTNAHGIFVSDVARGDISITASGPVSAVGGHGIHTYNSRFSSPGGGSVRVTASGRVSARGRQKDGIYISNKDRGSSSVTVSAGEVTGDRSAVRVFHAGRGDLTIRTTGRLVGRSGNTTDKSGVLHAYNEGSGDTWVTATALVTGDRIRFRDPLASGQGAPVVKVVNANASGGSSLTLSLDTVWNDFYDLADRGGFGDAVYVWNKASGTTSISARGGMIGGEQSGDGLVAKTGMHASTGAAMSVSVRDVAAAGVGMKVEHRGGGDLSIGAGSVEVRKRPVEPADQAPGRVIDVRNYTGGSSVRIRVGAARWTGGTGSGDPRHGAEAVWIDQRASGAVEFTATGEVKGGRGIHVKADASSGSSGPVRASGTVTGRGGIAAI